MNKATKEYYLRRKQLMDYRKLWDKLGMYLRRSRKKTFSSMELIDMMRVRELEEARFIDGELRKNIAKHEDHNKHKAHKEITQGTEKEESQIKLPEGETG